MGIYGCFLLYCSFIRSQFALNAVFGVFASENTWVCAGYSLVYKWMLICISMLILPIPILLSPFNHSGNQYFNHYFWALPFGSRFTLILHGP